MNYKWSCHGHKDELNPNFLNMYNRYNKERYDKWVANERAVEWMPGKYIHDVSYTLHPVAKEIWRQTKPFDKNELPEVLKNHPRFND